MKAMNVVYYKLNPSNFTSDIKGPQAVGIYFRNKQTKEKVHVAVI
jgi:hypothetical protein